ncbi:MAG: STAS/SEC14 domain-containing protein [Pseudomonadota bacterium]|nr:STAS/SEC14 domain-containing protein [Pseudomonadota bacterium]
MLTVDLMEKEGIALLRPEGALTEEDFKYAARIIDSYIENSGKLNGIIINVRSFPGWASFSALTKHLSFIKEHHKKVSRVAFSTDSPLLEFAEPIARHFVDAEIKHFSFNELNNAIEWASEA